MRNYIGYLAYWILFLTRPPDLVPVLVYYMGKIDLCSLALQLKLPIKKSFLLNGKPSNQNRRSTIALGRNFAIFHLYYYFVVSHGLSLCCVSLSSVLCLCLDSVSFWWFIYLTFCLSCQQSTASDETVVEGLFLAPITRPQQCDDRSPIVNVIFF